MNPYHKDNSTSTYFVTSLYETQNVYCQVYWQQLLYKKLIMNKNKDYMDYTRQQNFTFFWNTRENIKS